MDELPELPFEQVLSYLSLEDRLKARAVSRRWYHKNNSFKVQTLCYSKYPMDTLLIGCWGINGAFAENFISSTRFTTFFDTFGQTIFSSLKHLRLYDIDLRGNETALTRTLNLFGQLEQLDIMRIELNWQEVFKLNLPMLTSLQLEEVNGIEKLVLEAPSLRDVKILDCYETDLERLEIVHGESVERLLVDLLECIDPTNQHLMNQSLYVDQLLSADSTFLSILPQLKEFHTNDCYSVLGLFKLFQQKHQSGRADLKIYLRGLLLNDPYDPAINALRDSSRCLRGKSFACLAENRSRLADQIPFYRELDYSSIEGVAPGLEVNIVKRCIELSQVSVDDRVEDIERFLDLLKNCENISKLSFSCDQPWNLFDLLPEHCAVRNLIFNRLPADLDFLFRLKHLILLDIRWPIDSETVRRAFEELPVLSCFSFEFDQKRVSIHHPKLFEISFDSNMLTFSDLNAAIEFISGIQKRRRPGLE